MSVRTRKASIAGSLACLAAACVAAAVLLSAADVARATPRSFFGIVPQASLSEEDAEYMRAGRIGSIRLAIGWESVQPARGGTYNWEGTDREIATAAEQGLRVLPFLSGVPRWVSQRTTRLPIDSARARQGWTAFVKAAVKRYGPGGEFWAEHTPAVAKDGIVIRRPLPIRTWQIWNEANFFYFAFPVSPTRYARLLKLSYRAVKSADPGAKILLSGLFGEPDEGGKRGMSAADFLAALYKVPGIRHYFDAVALHPYAFHVSDLEAMVEDMRAVVRENHDPGAGLYITEMGWGSQNDPNVVAFEQGIGGQARELRAAYRYLLANRRRLNLKAAYWFTWKDSRYYCSFCDSVGLFRESRRFHAKPAWHAFVRITGGRARP
jgi:polysaccharide biosynthesis protein PslG